MTSQVLQEPSAVLLDKGFYEEDGPCRFYPSIKAHSYAADFLSQGTILGAPIAKSQAPDDSFKLQSLFREFKAPDPMLAHCESAMLRRSSRT